MAAKMLRLLIALTTSVTMMFFVLVLSNNYRFQYGKIYNVMQSPRQMLVNLTVTQNNKNNIPLDSYCVDRFAKKFQRVEDIYCENLPPFLPHLKNPCFYEMLQGSQRKLQCLPYFYILGMDKSATTDLHNRIMSHPDVRGNRGSIGKETQFWSWKRYGFFNYKYRPPNLYLGDYFKFFNDTSLELENVSHHSVVITGDATPMDLWDFRFWDMIPQNLGKAEPEILTPHLLKYIYKDRSHPKMLVQLREPVERLYSDYVFLGLGHDPIEFHYDVIKSVSIMADCMKTKSQRLCYFDKSIYQRLPTRIHLGCYSVFLKEWLRVFPLSAFHVTRMEDFQLHMKQTLQDVFSYLELEPLPDNKLKIITTKERKHVTDQKRGTILPNTAAILRQFYRPCLQETASLLNDTRFLWNDVYSAKAGN